MSVATQFGKPSALILVVLSVIGRLVPHPANFTPLGATALFGGAKLSRPWNYLAPLFVLFVTDLVIGLHGTMLYVYGGFLVSAWLGEKFLRQPKLTKVVGISLLGSLSFFTISNLGVWMEGILYPKTIAGLIDCYIAALPFLRNTVLGDVIFAGTFFTAYGWVENQALAEKFDKTLTGWLVGSR